MTKIHELKIAPKYFEKVLSKEKTFEFSEIEETKPKTLHRLTFSELRIESFIAQAKPFLDHSVMHEEGCIVCQNYES